MRQIGLQIIKREELEFEMPKKLDTTSRVIIIGNSPSILLHKYGKQIDSYDVVIRLNRCVTKGFEKFIGNKIDIWATTHKIFMEKDFKSKSEIT
jgi:hypothetical protein